MNTVYISYGPLCVCTTDTQATSCFNSAALNFNIPVSGLEETGEEPPPDTTEAGPLEGGTARLSANQDEYFSV